jgi:hypothetical protein
VNLTNLCSDQLLLGPALLPTWFDSSNRKRVWSRLPIVVGRNPAYGDPASSRRTAARWVEVEVVERRFSRKFSIRGFSHEFRVTAYIPRASVRTIPVSHSILYVVRRHLVNAGVVEVIERGTFT